jgi:sugar O-acyltransferase (sialic acid O-acetyltransferase NeuD family)
MANSHINKFPPSVILWGGTGQAKVVRPIIEHFGAKVIAVFDQTKGLKPPFPDVDLYLGWDDFPRWIAGRDRSDIGFCVAIGNPHGRARIENHERLVGEGLMPVTLAHPTAWIADNAQIGVGAQILAGAIVCEEAVLGRQCIINTRASVDHECVLEDGVELAPAATFCGLVHAAKHAWICAGATVLPRVRIGKDAIVGAGAVVIDNVPAGKTVVGVPARVLEDRKKS